LKISDQNVVVEQVDEAVGRADSVGLVDLVRRVLDCGPIHSESSEANI
jgi:hypothetical protein